MNRKGTYRSRLFLSTVMILPGTIARLAAQTDSAGFNWWFPPQSSTSAAEIDAEFMLIFWITVTAVGVVFTLLGIVVWRYRFREGRVPSAIAGNARLEFIWGGIMLAILILLAINSQAVWGGLKTKPQNPDLIVEVRPRQFQWDVRYAGRDDLFGTPDDITAINQITVPLGKQVLVRLKAQDVIHSFFVPEFRMKQDAVPGMETNFWFRATRLGKLEIACAELCGLGHGVMRGILTVISPDSFDTWYQKKMEDKRKLQGGKVAAMETLRTDDSVMRSSWIEGRPPFLLRQAHHERKAASPIVEVLRGRSQ